MFEDAIRKLIALKHEGGYWDFKKQWYDAGVGLGDLLIDIICMANNLENRECYIIIGVNENDGHSLIDTSNDSNRKNTQNIVDFLKDKDFVGGMRPMIRVESVVLDGTILDILVVENSYNTPFVLASDYRNIKAHHIYTRVQDVNTARDKSADIDKIEKLYRKRFRLDEAPLKRVQHYLEDLGGWEKAHSDSGEEYYYTHANEQFTVTFKSGSEDERCEFWSLMFPASGRHNCLEDIVIAWNGITLSNDYFYASLDDGRSSCVMPELGTLEVAGNYYRYFYLIQGSLRHLLYEFVWSKVHHTDVGRYRGTIEDHFIIFDNKDQQLNFDYFIHQNSDSISGVLAKEHVSPDNDHLKSVGFYYGFNNLDKNDYLDSRYFVSLYSTWLTGAIDSKMFRYATIS